MALKKSYLSSDGVTHPDAYHRIGDMKVIKRNKTDESSNKLDTMVIPVEIYHDSTPSTG